QLSCLLHSLMAQSVSGCQAVAKAKKSVAVVGAGAAGLAVAATLRRSCLVTVFERSSDFVGGVWNYSSDRNGGPMYCRLRTNLPKEIMAYPDWEWRRPAGVSFVDHDSVLEYLRSYCYDQGLYKHILFGHEVLSVSQSASIDDTSPTDTGSRSWIVQTSRSGPRTFDAVVLANGHYAKPMLPRLPGIENVPSGLVSHSCTYRRAEDFKDKVVALLGAASSGQDIALELTSSAEHVYLCHRGPRLQSALPKNLTELYAMDSVNFDANNNQFHIFVSTDDSSSAIGKVQVDHVMFCTGYDYNFPFLASELTRPSHVPNLYMQVAHCTLQGLFFVGLCTHVVPFPQFHLQSKLIEAILLGQLKLPDDAESTSLRDEAEKLASGVPARHLHLLGDDQWDYNDQLADLAGCQRLPVVMRLIYDDVRLERKLRLVDFRQWDYSITGPDSFEKRFVS
ncbi:hypothetical protein BOX15_Mlig025579g2, partial [Macrostomum lignano]